MVSHIMGILTALSRNIITSPVVLQSILSRHGAIVSHIVGLFPAIIGAKVNEDRRNTQSDSWHPLRL